MKTTIDVYVTHALKVELCYYENLRLGKKKCEIRLNDRDYQVGDRIRFLSVKDRGALGGEWLITHVHSGLGLKEGYVALSGEWL